MLNRNDEAEQSLDQMAKKRGRYTHEELELKLQILVVKGDIGSAIQIGWKRLQELGLELPDNTMVAKMGFPEMRQVVKDLAERRPTFNWNL